MYVPAVRTPGFLTNKNYTLHVLLQLRHYAQVYTIYIAAAIYNVVRGCRLLRSEMGPQEDGKRAAQAADPAFFPSFACDAQIYIIYLVISRSNIKKYTHIPTQCPHGHTHTAAKNIQNVIFSTRDSYIQLVGS